MFDLFRSRAKAVRYLLGGLLLLVAVSMVITLIPGYGVSTGDSQEQVVAEIGKEALTMREVQLQAQSAIRNKAFPPELAQIYVPQIVDRMITDRALAYEAKRLGFEVTKTDVANAIQAAFPQLYQDGRFVGKDVYAAFLEQQNLSIPEFESNMRKQLLLMKLQNMVADGVIVTPAEVEKAYRDRNEKIKLEYIAFSPDKFRSQVQVSPAELQAYFEKNRAQFQIPEKRSVALLVVDEAKVGQNITVSDAELRRTYEQNKDQYRVPERVEVRHILLKTTDKPQAEIPKIQAKAEDLLKQIKGGADFAALAKKYSEDPGSAAKGGDLGWIVRGQTVKAFEDTAFSLKPGQISNVIKTEYGFHIIQVMKKEEARVKPFEEVKDQLLQERKKQMVYDTMQKLADQAHDELTKNPQNAQEIASRLGIEYVDAGKISSTDQIPALGGGRDLQDALSGLGKGQVSPVFQVQGNKLVVATVTDVFPARQAELSDVENQVRERLISEKTAQLLEQKARAAADQAKANGDLKQVAKSMGLEVKTTQDFDRNGAADGIGAASYLLDGFTAPVGSTFGPVTLANQRFVCKVVNKIPADMTKLPAQRASLMADLKAQKARERNELFEDSLITGLIKQGKVKIHRDVINRLVASYRS